MAGSTATRCDVLARDWHCHREVNTYSASGQCGWPTDGVRCGTAGTVYGQRGRLGRHNLLWLCGEQCSGDHTARGARDEADPGCDGCADGRCAVLSAHRRGVGREGDYPVSSHRHVQPFALRLHSGPVFFGERW